MRDRLSYPVLLAGGILAAAAMLWAAGPKPAAIPTPIYQVQSTYSSAGDTLTETRRVRPTNMPATSKSWWITTVTPIVHVVYEGGELYVFPWKGGPSPNPDPQPDPIPPVPVPVTELWCIVVEESASRTAEQGIVLASPKVRALFPAAGGFRLIDPWKDAARTQENGPIPTELRPYVDRAKPVPILPVCYLVEPNGTVHYEGPLPKTVPDVEALVARIKKGGAR